MASSGVDLILTSPPYAGAQKYIRASSLSIGWLHLAQNSRLRPLEATNIGREHLSRSERETIHSIEASEMAEVLSQVRDVNPLRADIFATYIGEMSAAAKAIVHSLKRGGHMVLVMGDNEICGIPVPTSNTYESYSSDLY